MSSILDALQFMIDIADDNTHGYDQTNRNGPDYDCSSLVGTALNHAGFNVSPESWTGNLYPQLIACGFIEVNGSERQPGDIFLTPYKHVIMCVNTNTIVHASGNEYGKATGGKTGDQTGKEICTRSFYVPSYGWKYHLRYTGDHVSEPGELEERLKVDGLWGIKTTKRAQQKLGTTIDGIISDQRKEYRGSNPGCLSETFEWLDKPGQVSELIGAIQKMVGAKVDKWIGPDTIRKMQTYFGTVQDGCISYPSDVVKAMQRWLNE